MPRVPPSAGIYNLALSVFPFKIDTSSPKKVNARCPAKSILCKQLYLSTTEAAVRTAYWFSRTETQKVR